MHYSVSVNDFDALRLSVASPQDILSWSYGEVLKPETINYRTQRAERGGLFCERIFGPTKNYRCYCGKYKRIRYKGVVCDRCGVEVTHSSVRRFRMGHIKLAAPIIHPWFLRSNPGILSKVLEIPQKKLEQVIYFAGYIVMSVNGEERDKILKENEKVYEKAKKKLIEGFEAKLEGAKDAKEKKKIEAERVKQETDLEANYKLEKDRLEKLKPKTILSEEQYYTLSFKYSYIFKAGIGASAILDIIKSVNLEKEIARVELGLADEKVSVSKSKKLRIRLQHMKGMVNAGIDPEWFFMTALPVIPPDLRPMVELDGGRFATSDLNDLYRAVITRNNRLKKLLSASAPDVITRNEKRMLQESVDALIDKNKRSSGRFSRRKELKSISDLLRGKKGRFRQNLLGKRVDYSGRAVIIPGPNLKLHQCGVPKTMALELFQPFVISKLIKLGYAHNVKSAKKMIFDQLPEVWDVLGAIVKKRVVLLNRAPTLHILSMLSFEPVLIEGKAIQIHPLVCAGYNADFDGDQMAIHLPVSTVSQKEGNDIMLGSKNLLKPSDGKPIVLPSHEMVLGIYYLTFEKDGFAKSKVLKHFSSPSEMIMSYRDGHVDLHDKIAVLWEEKGGMVYTTPGRVMFNSVLPKDMGYINKSVDNSKLKKIVFECFNNFGQETTAITLDEIKRIGFKFATYSGITYAGSDLTVSKDKYIVLDKAEEKRDAYYQAYKNGFITNDERKNLTVIAWMDAKDTLADDIKKNIRDLGSMGYLAESGARGKLEHVNQVIGMKGLVSNPKGEVVEVPIKNSFKEGLTAIEYFAESHGGRKGKSDTALKTADAGYLTRRMVDVSQDIFVKNDDCGSEKGIQMIKGDAEDLGLTLGERVAGRYLSEDLFDNNEKLIAKSGELITSEISKRIDRDEIEVLEVRSPLYCETNFGVCKRCYGEDPSRGETVELGRAVGIIAAQSIGEPGLQLTLRTFHMGGTAGSDIIQGLPRVEELFEARSRYPAVLSEISGTVKIEETRSSDTVHILIQGSEGDTEKLARYKSIPVGEVLVKDGEEVERGDVLTRGNPHPDEIYDLLGKRAAERYILNEIQKVYVGQGQEILDKHIEVILSRMFSMSFVQDSGSTDLLEGDFVSKEIINAQNSGAKVKAITKPTLLGISKAAQNTQSFLSAASFEETTKTLIDASVKGKIDLFQGLKENVMVGKLIPCGTGFREKTLNYLDPDLMSKLEKVKFN